MMNIKGLKFLLLTIVLVAYFHYLDGKKCTSPKRMFSNTKCTMKTGKVANTNIEKNCRQECDKNKNCPKSIFITSTKNGKKYKVFSSKKEEEIVKLSIKSRKKREASKETNNSKKGNENGIFLSFDWFDYTIIAGKIKAILARFNNLVFANPIFKSEKLKDELKVYARKLFANEDTDSAHSEDKTKTTANLAKGNKKLSSIDMNDNILFRAKRYECSENKDAPECHKEAAITEKSKDETPILNVKYFKEFLTPRKGDNYNGEIKMKYKLLNNNYKKKESDESNSLKLMEIMPIADLNHNDHSTKGANINVLESTLNTEENKELDFADEEEEKEEKDDETQTKESTRVKRQLLFGEPSDLENFLNERHVIPSNRPYPRTYPIRSNEPHARNYQNLLRGSGYPKKPRYPKIPRYPPMRPYTTRPNYLNYLNYLDNSYGFDDVYDYLIDQNDFNPLYLDEYEDQQIHDPPYSPNRPSVKKPYFEFPRTTQKKRESNVNGMNELYLGQSSESNENKDGQLNENNDNKKDVQLISAEKTDQTKPATFYGRMMNQVDTNDVKNTNRDPINTNRDAINMISIEKPTILNKEILELNYKLKFDNKKQPENLHVLNLTNEIINQTQSNIKTDEKKEQIQENDKEKTEIRVSETSPQTDGEHWRVEPNEAMKNEKTEGTSLFKKLGRALTDNIYSRSTEADHKFDKKDHKKSKLKIIKAENDQLKKTTKEATKSNEKSNEKTTQRLRFKRKIDGEEKQTTSKMIPYIFEDGLEDSHEDSLEDGHEDSHEYSHEDNLEDNLEDGNEINMRKVKYEYGIEGASTILVRWEDLLKDDNEKDRIKREVDEAQQTGVCIFYKPDVESLFECENSADESLEIEYFYDC